MDELKNKLNALLIELISENNDRSIAMNDKDASKYLHNVLRHRYNNTLDIIKRIEKLM